jgi:hypothetical protein
MLASPAIRLRELRFELRRPNKAYELPQKIVTFTVAVR